MQTETSAVSPAPWFKPAWGAHHKSEAEIRRALVLPKADFKAWIKEVRSEAAVRAGLVSQRGHGCDETLRRYRCEAVVVAFFRALGMKQRVLARALGVTQGRISQRLKDWGDTPVPDALPFQSLPTAIRNRALQLWGQLRGNRGFIRAILRMRTEHAHAHANARARADMVGAVLDFWSLIEAMGVRVRVPACARARRSPKTCYLVAGFGLNASGGSNGSDMSLRQHGQ